jgi:hypothetical protein
MSISSLNFEDTLFNAKKWKIESSSSEIKYKNILFLFSLSIKTISNSGGSWFIDNSKYVQSWNSTSIFSSLSLRVVELSWNSNNSRFNGFTKICFSNFFHLNKNHWWDLLSLEFFSLSFVLNNNNWYVVNTWFYFEWP